MEQPQTERLGVAALDMFFSRAGWLFREQTTLDYGIDAHIEIVEEQTPTGKIIALQIKSGLSFFKEETLDSYVYRTDGRHIEYWVNHSMPVVIVLYNPETQSIYWQYLSKESVEETGKNWKILVPKANTFENSNRVLKAFKSLTQPEPYIRRLNRLRIDRRWMDLISEGEEVKVQFDDWVNKSLSRYQITISCGREREAWPTLYAPGISIEVMLSHYFPWADFELDSDAHEEGAEPQWESECYMGRDSDTGRTYYSQDFDRWYKPQSGVIPVSENGETASYSLILRLNDLGNSFLEIDDYLSDSLAPDNIGFTLK